MSDDTLSYDQLFDLIEINNEAELQASTRSIVHNVLTRGYVLDDERDLVHNVMKAYKKLH